jgi:hypothetical protein
MIEVQHHDTQGQARRTRQEDVTLDLDLEPRTVGELSQWIPVRDVQQHPVGLLEVTSLARQSVLELQDRPLDVVLSGFDVLGEAVKQLCQPAFALRTTGFEADPPLTSGEPFQRGHEIVALTCGTAIADQEHHLR